MTLIKYEIYTEAKNVPEIIKIVSKYCVEFTVTPSTGFWRGSKEQSLKIEFMGIKQDKELICYIAERIKSYNQQEAVLVTMTKISGELV